MWPGILIPAAARLAGAMSMPLIRSRRTLPLGGCPGRQPSTASGYRLVEELLVPMQLVAVIAEAKDKRVLVKTIALERRDDLANLFIGFEQAIVMVGNLFAHLGDVGIIGRHRDGGTIDCGTGAPAQFAAAKLHLPKKRLALFAVLPAVAGDQ